MLIGGKGCVVVLLRGFTRKDDEFSLRVFFIKHVSLEHER